MNIIPINYYLLTNFAKQNVGVTVYTWNGNGYTQSHYQQASKLEEYIHWIVGIDVVDGLRPIARCKCVWTTPFGVECKANGQGSHPCGWSIFNSSCTGDCNYLIKAIIH